MPETMYGADVVALRRLAETFRASGASLQNGIKTLSASVTSISWAGPDGSRFRHSWDAEHVSGLQRAVRFLDVSAETLLRNAAEQEQASAAAGGQIGGGAVSSTGASAAPSPAVFAGKSPAEVKAVWDRLTEEQKQAFIREHPVEAGNTNGIPFDVRVEANKLNAASRLEWLKTQDPEPKFDPVQAGLGGQGYTDQLTRAHDAWAKRQSGRDYLQSVVDGKVKLAAFDPAHDSIVEMIGNYNTDTKHVITYVPGTFTNEASFYHGEIQSLPANLVAQDRSGGTVAFVYKGTTFPDGPAVKALLGDAKDDDFVKRTAPVLAGFQDAVDLERPPGAESDGVGWSWGLRNITGSEIYKAHYDKVIALSGAAMPPGWEPQRGTSYSSFSYPDILQTAEANGLVGDNYPLREPAFEKHFYDPDTGNQVTSPLDAGRIHANPFNDFSAGNHNRIVETSPRNESVIQGIRKEIYSK